MPSTVSSIAPSRASSRACRVPTESPRRRRSPSSRFSDFVDEALGRGPDVVRRRLKPVLREIRRVENCEVTVCSSSVHVVTALQKSLAQAAVGSVSESSSPPQPTATSAKAATAAVSRMRVLNRLEPTCCAPRRAPEWGRPSTTRPRGARGAALHARPSGLFGVLCRAGERRANQDRGPSRMPPRRHENDLVCTDRPRCPRDADCVAEGRPRTSIDESRPRWCRPHAVHELGLGRRGRAAPIPRRGRRRPRGASAAARASRAAQIGCRSAVVASEYPRMATSRVSCSSAVVSTRRRAGACSQP